MEDFITVYLFILGGLTIGIVMGAVLCLDGPSEYASASIRNRYRTRVLPLAIRTVGIWMGFALPVGIYLALNDSGFITMVGALVIPMYVILNPIIAYLQEER